MTRLIPTSCLALALAPLLLCSCGKSASPQAGPTASGEILPGTVSDAMLDTDRSQAEAPLAPAAHSTSAKTGAGAATESAAAEDPATAPAAASAEQTPDASPKPAANIKPTAP